MNKKNNDGNMKFTENEVLAIYKVLNGRTIDLDSLNWNYNLMQEILAGVSENKSSAIDTSILFKKLFLSSDAEILEILINNDIYWGMENENPYKSQSKISPKEKLLEISKNSSQTPLKWDDDKINDLEFLMMSQTMKHDLIVYVGESFDENYATWSTTKDNFHKLLDELALSNQTIEIQKLEVVKENIFK